MTVLPLEVEKGFDLDGRIREVLLNQVDQDQDRDQVGARAAPGGPAPLGSYRLIHENGKKENYRLPPTERTRRFRQYLSQTMGQKIDMWGMATRSGELEDVYASIPYVHRWTDVYRKKTLAKFYLLETWWNCHRPPLAMLTLTTYQSGAHSVRIRGHRVTREESFEILKQSWDKLLMALRYYLGPFDYVGLLEPHKSGYPHLHVLLFREVSEGLQERVRGLWCDKYEAGSREHGVDFTVKNLDDIKSVKNYLMKYLGKSFYEYQNNHNYLIFNTIVWERGYRLFTCSRHLSRVMARYQEETEASVTWLTTELVNEYDEKIEIWKNPTLNRGVFEYGK